MIQIDTAVDDCNEHSRAIICGKPLRGCDVRCTLALLCVIGGGGDEVDLLREKQVCALAGEGLAIHDAQPIAKAQEGTAVLAAKASG